MIQYALMKSNEIVADARVMQVRELKKSLAETRERLLRTESDLNLLRAHFSLGMVALHDFEGLAGDAEFRIVDGWNAILKRRNVSKLSAEEISGLKKEYLANLGIPAQESGCAEPPPVGTWIVFDGKVANSYRAGACRVTYTGGTGAHRADRMIVDFVNAAKVLGLDVARISVETADKDLIKRLSAAGVKVV